MNAAKPASRSDAVKVAVDPGPWHYPHLSEHYMSFPSLRPACLPNRPKLAIFFAPRSGSAMVAVGLGPRLDAPDL